jgi:hypothetical protein
MFRPLFVAMLVSLCACALLAQQAGMPYTPKFPGDPAHSDSEAGALGYMRTLVTAERAYFKKHTKYATSLAQLAASPGSFTKRMAHTDRGDYTVYFHGAPTKFYVQMTPKQFDAAHRAFWDNENGIIHVESDKPATEQSPVLRPD